ncbi:MAG: RNA 2',3'-cyclic phosphodiesterase [Candidatus Omnitrophota bacterium]
MTLSTVRSFIAVEISKESQELIRQCQEYLKGANADIKWVDPNNSHLTLKFLGEISENQINEVKKALSRVSRHFSVFPFELSELGGFPSLEKPRTIWIGGKKGQDKTRQLSEAIKNELIEAGFPKGEHQEFNAHITLGRLRSSHHCSDLIKALNEYSIDFPITQEIDKIILFKSTLTAKGPIYEPLEGFILKDSEGKG